MKILTDLNLDNFKDVKAETGEPEAKKVEPSKDISRMPLEEFSKSDLILAVYSKLLGETIFFASNEDAITKCGTLAGPVYTAMELETILASGARGEDLRAIHQAKTIFNGRLYYDGQN